jgi:hypothetical protein
MTKIEPTIPASGAVIRTPSLLRYQRLATEFDRKLAGTGSLIDVAEWYGGQYILPANLEVRLDHGNWDCSVAERAALALNLADFKSEAEIATRDCECTNRRGDACTCYATLKSARADVGRYPLTGDLEVFEMRVDWLRRYAAAPHPWR